MSDFLSRENELLGGQFSSTVLSPNGNNDEIDFDRAASAFPDIDLEGIPQDTPPVSARNQNTGFSFEDFSPPSREVKVTGDDELEKFETEFPDIGVPQTFSPAPTQPTFGAIPPFAPRPQPSAFTSTPILSQPLEEEEPQVIKEWREKQAEQIAARDKASVAKREETIAKAERSIDEFYEEYSAKQEKAVRENKIEEEEYLSSLSASLSAGTTWARISDLVELQNSQSKTIARTGAGTTDLTRFKEVLLRLMREGDAAPGAAGY